MSLTVRDVQRARAGCNSRTQQCGRIDDPPARWRRHRSPRRSRVAICASPKPTARSPVSCSALREGTPYDSPNYRWFSERYPEFVYIDRIVIARPFRRLGLGRVFYADVTSYAEVRVPVLTCEVFLEPRDDISVLFHGTYGFQEVGQQTMPGVGPPRRAARQGSVQLSVRARHLPRAPTACRTCRGSPSARARGSPPRSAPPEASEIGTRWQPRPASSSNPSPTSSSARSASPTFA